jgi:quercetin dioxygenase-like cupin family protein
MMPYFYDASQRTTRENIPGVTLRTFWGDKMLLALIDLAPGAVIPPHSHPHEQAGTLVSGEMEMTVGGETRTVRVGDVYIVPGDVVHSVAVGPAGAQAVEVFAPAREEYKFPD